MSLTAKVTKEDIIRISGADPYKCMACGKCSGACPSYGEMEYHPHQFAALVKKGQTDRLMASDAIYKCISCFACSERCPRGVEPSKIIEAVRLAVIRQKGNNHIKPESIPEKLNDKLPGQAIVSVMRKYSK